MIYYRYFVCFTGDDDKGSELGFLGCMRELEVGTEAISYVKPENNIGVINGTCTIQDR